MYVEAINGSRHPAGQRALHTCYGINEGPRVHDAALAESSTCCSDRAGAYSFEAANPRHEHEYHLWETVKLPDGKVLSRA